MHTERVILFLDMAGRNPANVRHTSDNRAFGLNDFGWRIPTRRFFVEVGDTVGFYKLSVIHFRSKTALDGFWIRCKGIGSNLDATGKTASQIFHESASVVQVAFADDKRGNQLGFGIQGNERPNIPVCTNATGNFALCANEAPNLINFDLPAVEGAHLLVHDFLATLADTHRL